MCNVRPESLSILTVGTRASCDVAFWDVKRNQVEFSLNVGHSVDFALVSTAHKAVVCGGIDSGAVLAISLTGGSVEHASRAEEYRGMTDMTVAVDNIFIATPASGVAVISVSDGVATGKLCDPDGPSVPTKLLVNSCSDAQLIVGYEHGLIHIFDVDTETVICSLSGHSGRVNSLRLLPSGQLVSAADDLRGIIWNHEPYLDQRSPGSVAAEHGMWTRSEPRGQEMEKVDCGDVLECSLDYRASCFTVDGTQRLIYAGFVSGLVQIWDLETGQCRVCLHLFVCDSAQVDSLYKTAQCLGKK